MVCRLQVRSTLGLFVCAVISSYFPGCSCIISKNKEGEILTFIVMFVWDMESLGFLFFKSKCIKMLLYCEVFSMFV